jgi:hypothetical protein
MIVGIVKGDRRDAKEMMLLKWSIMSEEVALKGGIYNLKEL